MEKRRTLVENKKGGERRKMKRIFLGIMLVIAVLSFSLAGCGTDSPLEDIRWVLTSYGDPDSLTNVLPDTELTALFDSEAKQLRGSGGCNTFTGEYERDGDNLTLTGPLAVTEMWCGDEIGDQESAYLEILLAAESYEIDGDILQINCGGNVLNYERE
jgi:heat shock protein HslJ